MKQFSFLLLFIFVFGCALARPAVVHMPDGVYASLEDQTMQCLNNGVCIGNEYAAQNISDLRLNRITHVVSAIGCLINYSHYGITCYSEMIDDTVAATAITQVLARTTQQITFVLATWPDARVFVHCQAGVSRSSSIVLAHMLSDRTKSFDTALHELRQVRSVVRPNPLFECVLRNYAAGLEFNDIDAHKCKEQILLLE